MANGYRYRDSDSDSDLGLYSNMWTNLNAKETCYIAQLVTGWHVGTRLRLGERLTSSVLTGRGIQVSTTARGRRVVRAPSRDRLECATGPTSLERRGRPRSK